MKMKHYMLASAGVLGAMTANERAAGRYLRDGGGHPETAAEMAAKFRAEQQKAIKEAVDPIRDRFEEFLGKSAKGEKLLEDFKGEVDENLTKLNKRLDEEFARIEQKMVRGDQGGSAGTKSFGQQFVECEELKALASSPRSGASANMPVKADMTTAVTDAAGSAGAAIAPNRLAGVQELPQRRLTVRDLLTPGNTDSPLIQYVQETGFNNNAAMVAEGAAKPQSDIKLADKDVSTKVIAHWFRASKQILSDFPQIRSMIDGRLIYGLALKEEAQLLNGDGTGENLLGLIPQATAFAIPAGYTAPAPLTAIDRLRIAQLQAALAEFPATGHVLNDIDWAGIETLKDNEGRYIIGNPQGTLRPTLWGLPVVATQAILVGKFLTGAFRMGAQIFDQWASRIEVGFQNDDFIRNKVTILGEERLALAVYRPEAFIYGDVNAPAQGG